jgi:hypothetical protein
MAIMTDKLSTNANKMAAIVDTMAVIIIKMTAIIDLIAFIIEKMAAMSDMIAFMIIKMAAMIGNIAVLIDMIVSLIDRREAVIDSVIDRLSSMISIIVALVDKTVAVNIMMAMNVKVVFFIIEVISLISAVNGIAAMMHNPLKMTDFALVTLPIRSQDISRDHMNWQTISRSVFIFVRGGAFWLDDAVHLGHSWELIFLNSESYQNVAAVSKEIKAVLLLYLG